MTDLAKLWQDSMRRARRLDPDRISRRITAVADNGLRSARFDREGSQTTSVPCEDPERCFDGPGEHSHQIAADPTGNAAIRDRRTDSASSHDLRYLDNATGAFVTNANVVLEWVSGKRPTTWSGVLHADAKLMPGTIQAGLDVDDARVMPRAISAVESAVSTVETIARHYLPREPSQDERHWTSGMADEDCCVWHLAIHRRYRRPRAEGKNICADCVHLVLLADGARPPMWLLEAEVDRESKPKAWTAALGRWLESIDEPRAS